MELLELKSKVSNNNVILKSPIISINYENKNKTNLIELIELKDEQIKNLKNIVNN